MILNKNFTLNNGVKIPQLGLGTWMINNKNVVSAVQEAIKLGYRHIDTAQAYGNEKGVGEGVRKSGVKRDDIFVTTKLAAEIKSYKKAVASIDSSLETLGIEHIDLMLIHSPQPWTKFREEERSFDAGNLEAWKALEEAYQAGKIRSIGLANFEEADIDNILQSCAVKPMVNQILAHISNTPTDLIAYSQKKGMLVEAYSPIAHGELLKNQEVAQIAEKYDVSIPQLSIRYCLQLGLLPLPKTAHPNHMKENANVDFTISQADMNILQNVAQIENYGDASMFPVYGGKMNLRNMAKMAINSIKSNKS